MRKYLCIIMISLLMTSGCSYLKTAATVLGIGTSGSGLSVDAQIGDREAEVGGTHGTGDIEVEDNGQVEVNTSENDIEAKEVTIENAPSWWMMLLLILPWFITSPQDIYRKLKNRKG